MEVDAKTLQTRLLDMAKQFHALCVANGLRYYVIGGTCIGARRHRGFIPWDDDIDVGMPRSDYEKLCALPKTAFPENLELRFYRNTPNSPFHFVKLVDNTTTVVERAYLDYVEGLFLDVFPLDGAENPDNSFWERLRFQRIWFLKGMIYYHCMTWGKKSWLKKMLVFVAKHMSLRKLHERTERLMTRRAYGDSEYAANFFGAWKEKEVYPKRLLGNPTLYSFEDTELYGPEDIDGYLRHVYGDFMRLPPVEKRVFKHNYHYLDWNKGFHEWEGQTRLSFDAAEKNTH